MTSSNRVVFSSLDINVFSLIALLAVSNPDNLAASFSSSDNACSANLLASSSFAFASPANLLASSSAANFLTSSSAANLLTSSSAADLLASSSSAVLSFTCGKIIFLNILVIIPCGDSAPFNASFTLFKNDCERSMPYVVSVA